jgi:hypothetical protein
MTTTAISSVCVTRYHGEDERLGSWETCRIAERAQAQRLRRAGAAAARWALRGAAAVTARSSSLQRLVRRLWPLQKAGETTGNPSAGIKERHGAQRRPKAPPCRDGWNGEYQRSAGNAGGTGRDRNAACGKPRKSDDRDVPLGRDAEFGRTCAKAWFSRDAKSRRTQTRSATAECGASHAW